ncbi:MAG: tRNA pseudouridine(55) synthase TruB [Desulfosarcinaceae bacterium]|nr:tRNA pseudouridine(55) synthase TruB [Desulfosarcinaceae bacterium]
MRQRLNGFLVIDKPPEMTSAQVVARVKRLTRANKVGHTGTLDPFATGVLICCLNQATRLAGYLLKDTKRYRAVLHLGVTTDTQDSTGETVSTAPVDHLTDEAVMAAFRGFVGTFPQQPPTYSALKHRGVPLYKLARMGKPVRKAPREVTVFRLAIDEVALPHVTFEVTCSAGTYVRTLGADIGQKLGCGGHLTALRRLQSGPFGLETALQLEALPAMAAQGGLAVHLIEPARVFPHWQRVVADRALLRKVLHGQPVDPADLGMAASAAQKSDAPILVMGPDDRLVALLGYRPNSQKLRYHCVFAEEIIASGIV